MPASTRPNTHDEPEVAAAAAAQRGPPDRHEHERREEQPQEDGAARPDLVEQALGEARRRTAPRRSPAGRGGRAAPRDNARMAVTDSRAATARERSYEELEEIFAGTTAPFAFVDLDAMWSNAREMLGRAGGVPIRVASKSVRCRSLLASILEFDPGFRGLMTFTLPETLWLHGHGFRDLLVAYPSADREALGRACPARRRAPADRDGRLGRAARPDRGGGARRRPGARLHRPRPQLVAARRPRQDRRQALARARARAGARARGGDRAAAGTRARRR